MLTRRPLAGGAAAVRSWFARQCQGGAAAPIATMLLDVVNDLLGLTGVSGQGTEDIPWRIQGVIGADLLLGVAVWVGPSGPTGTPTLQVAVTFTGGVGPAAAFDAEVVLLAVPLSGIGPARLLPQADVRGRAPADPGAFLVGSAASDPRVGSCEPGSAGRSYSRPLGGAARRRVRGRRAPARRPA